MKKIVFFSPYYFHPIPSTKGGGVEELMTLLLEEHEKVKNPRYKFYFVMKKLYGKETAFEANQNYKNSEIVKVKYNRFFNFLIRGLNRFLKLLKIKKRFSNVYYNNAYKTVKKIDPDLIIFERDYDVITKKFAQNFGREKLAFHVHTQILPKERIENYFKTIISVSNFISNDWQQFLGERADVSYFVSTNCVNENRFNKQISQERRAEIRKKYGFEDDDFVTIICGRVSEEKGTDKLIDAVIDISEKKIKLLIVGSVNTTGNEKTPFLRNIQKQVLENVDRIKMTGYVKNSNLYEVYQSADLQVVPTVVEEAAGLVVVEGQLSGLPQIVTKSGGMVEYIDNLGAVVVEKDDNLANNLKREILNLYNNPKMREKMAEANKVQGTKFNKARYHEDFIEILDDVFKQNEGE